VSRFLQASGWVEYVRGIVPDAAPPNCASALLGAAAKWAAARGAPIVTYTLETEPGTSLIAAGWLLVGRTEKRKGGAQWSRGSRTRASVSGVVAGQKFRWISAQSLPAAEARGWKVEKFPHSP
jgi:hypothetical protein